jgi:hypothetical protein
MSNKGDGTHFEIFPKIGGGVGGIVIENENMIWGEICSDNTLFSKNKKFFPEIHPPRYIWHKLLALLSPYRTALLDQPRCSARRRLRRAEF